MDSHTNGKTTHHQINGKKEPDTSSLIQLASKITEETEKLNKYLKANPGLEADLSRLPDDLQRSRQEVLFATKELGALVRGPRESVRWGVWGVSETHASR